jgi:hypothetical protein
MLEVDVEALAELHIGARDQLLELRLALDQPQLSRAIAVELDFMNPALAGPLNPT